MKRKMVAFSKCCFVSGILEWVRLVSGRKDLDLEKDVEIANNL